MANRIESFGMTFERWEALNGDFEDKKGLRLTPAEITAGWHFCPEWDFLLTNYKDHEGEACTCDWVEGRTPWRNPRG
jgi:hypothetical protein